MQPSEIDTAQEIVGVLRAHRDALYSEGIAHLSVFGSVARGEGRPDSDVDICIELRPETKPQGFAQVGQIRALRERLSAIVGRPVDLVVLPVRKPRLQGQIDRDGIRAF